MTKSIIQEKSFQFALDSIALYKQIVQAKEYVISKQFLRSATSIGANVVEALAGQSRKDFLSKMSIASKEARETFYWLQLLKFSDLVKINVEVNLNKCDEIIRLLTAIVKTTKERLNANSKLKTQNS
jgi:four helix bundle protein